MKMFKLTLEEVEKITSGKLFGDKKHCITKVASLDKAESADAAFLSDPSKFELIHSSKAGVVIVPPECGTVEGKNLIVHPTPALAFEKVIDALYETFCQKTAFTSIHPTAIIHESVRLGKNVTVGPYSVIDQNVTIGDNTFIAASCSIGPGCTIGSDCILYPKVVLRDDCHLANRVIIHGGAVIGSCGFGFTQHQGKHYKQAQIGTVTIEDDVEIGANAAIDRARFETTRICRGSKIDNLCNIGHGTVIGEDNILVAQVGIAGSCKTGSHVILAGQVGVADHVNICNQVMVAAKSGISKSISKPGKYNGIPAMPLGDYNRMTVLLRNIETFTKQLQELKLNSKNFHK